MKKTQIKSKEIEVAKHTKKTLFFLFVDLAFSSLKTSKVPQ